MALNTVALIALIRLEQSLSAVNAVQMTGCLNSSFCSIPLAAGTSLLLFFLSNVGRDNFRQSIRFFLSIKRQLPGPLSVPG